MGQISPHQYLKELKDLMQVEKEKIKLQKEFILENKDFETAALYRDIEKKLNSFIDDLNFKK